MRVTLNADKHDLCFIGKIYFTFEDPGPRDINVDDLTPNEKVHMYAAWKSGKLFIEGSEELEKHIKVTTPEEQRAKQLVTQKAAKPPKPSMNEQELRRILREKITVIKETIPTLSLKETKELFELEKITKNRKQITSILSDIIDKQTRAVVDSIGEGKDEDMFKVNDKSVRGTLTIQQYLDSVGDVIESDIEEVTIDLGVKDDPLEE